MSLKVTLKNVSAEWRCDACDRQFNTALHLKQHKSRIHSHHRPYVCKLCFKAFRRINNLQHHHQRHHHVEDFPFICNVCDSSYSTRGQLRGHMRSHVHFHGHHECSYCGASFLNIAEARLHVLLVHNDPSVLPPDRPTRRLDDSGTLDGDDVFCVKEGDGLKMKIKLKRKSSADGHYESTTDDFNPGSHTSDSGKGNSDMDEDDVSRVVGNLLKTPTLVIKHNEDVVNSNQHLRPSHDSSLLMKPKLDIEQTQWGASKSQPRLDSSDFLTKTNFAGSTVLNRLTGSGFGSKLTPPRVTFGSPSHSGSFSSGMLNGSANMMNSDLKPPTFQSPPHSSPSLLSNTSSLFNTRPLLASNTNMSFSGGGSFNSKPMPGFMPNGPLNGTLFKTPLFQKNTASTFGQPLGFGAKTQTGLFGSAKSNFGQKTPSFGVCKFGMQSTMGPPTFQPLQSRNKNGQDSHEPIFGSREKVRNTVATKQEKPKQANAFEQYAGSGATVSSNPFADAMKKAKNPSPRHHGDSDLFEDSSSYYTESETDESETSTSSSEDEEVSLGDEEPVGPILPLVSDDAASVPGEVGSTPMQPWTSPLKPSRSPQKHKASPATSLTSPRNALLNNGEYLSPAQKRKLSVSQTSGPPSLPESPAAVQPISPPESATQMKRVKKSNTNNLVPSNRSLRRTRRSSSSSRSVISPQHQTNGDIGGEKMPLTEVYGHIDLETPAMSLSIPKVLLDQTIDYNKKSKTRTRSKRTPVSTPNPYAATPNYMPPTPAFDLPPPTPNFSAAQTPSYSAPPTPAYPPATPQYHAQTPVLPPPPSPAPVASAPAVKALPATPGAPNKYNPRIHAPTKEQMMARMRAKMKKPRKVRIGPKSFKNKVGRTVSDDEDASLFYKNEFVRPLSGRTDRFAPYHSRFKQNQTFLCYLRNRACDLILSLFPDIRVGGSFRRDSDDVDGLIDYIIVSLENQDSSSRCMRSMHSKRKEIEVVLCRAEKVIIRQLERKLCKLLKLILPSLSLQMMEREGIKTLPALIHKVITENVS